MWLVLVQVQVSKGDTKRKCWTCKTTTLCFSRSECAIRYKKQGVGLTSFCLFGYGGLSAMPSEVSFVQQVGAPCKVLWCAHRSSASASLALLSWLRKPLIIAAYVSVFRLEEIYSLQPEVSTDGIYSRDLDTKELNC